MVWSEHIFVMLLTHEKFTTFTTKPIANTKSHIAGLFSLSVDSVKIDLSLPMKGHKKRLISQSSYLYKKFF
jgi:predicted lactoylglutathione lyase